MDGQNFENNVNIEPVVEPAPVVEPTPVAEPVVEAVAEPVVEPIVEPVVETVSEAASESVYVNAGSYNYEANNTASDYQYTNAGSYNYQQTTSYTTDAGQYTSAATQYAPEYSDANQSSTPGLAIGALVMGIASILLSCCCGIGLLCGIGGLIMAIIANKKQKSGVGTAGLICSIAGIVLGVFYIIFNIFTMVMASV